jgi:hypothetical protein
MATGWVIEVAREGARADPPHSERWDVAIGDKSAAIAEVMRRTGVSLHQVIALHRLTDADLKQLGVANSRSRIQSGGRRKGMPQWTTSAELRHRQTSPMTLTALALTARTAALCRHEISPAIRSECSCMELLKGAGAVDADDAADIASLQRAETLQVVHRHKLAMRLGMVEADGMADLMRDGVAQIVDGEIAVEPNLPALYGIETVNDLSIWRVVPLPSFIYLTSA